MMERGDKNNRMGDPRGAAADFPKAGAGFLLRALRYRNYRLFFGGQLVSVTGSWMTNTATAWLVYRMTGSASMLGWLAFAGQFPSFLLAPLAGVYVDRLNRHRLLMVTQTLLSFSLGLGDFSANRRYMRTPMKGLFF